MMKGVTHSWDPASVKDGSHIGFQASSSDSPSWNGGPSVGLDVGKSGTDSPSRPFQMLFLFFLFAHFHNGSKRHRHTNAVFSLSSNFLFNLHWIHIVCKWLSVCCVNGPEFLAPLRRVTWVFPPLLDLWKCLIMWTIRGVFVFFCRPAAATLRRSPWIGRSLARRPAWVVLCIQRAAST